MRPLYSMLLSIITVVQLGCATDSAEYNITKSRAEDIVEVRVIDGRAYVVVESLRGIGKATIERTKQNWPRELGLHLHLAGLEKLEIFNGRTRLEVSVSSQSDQLASRQWKDGNESSLLDNDDQYWMRVEMFGLDGKPASGIPLQNGYFAIDLPARFLDEASETIEVNWVDFYR